MSEIVLQQYLYLSGLLMCIAIAGMFINRKNLLVLLMCIELLLLSSNLNFIAFSRFHQDIDGQVFVLFVLTVAATETAIGLAIIVNLFRSRKSIDVQDIAALRD